MTGKVGLDDYLAAGGKPEDLVAAATDSLPIEASPYFERHGSTYWNKPTRDDLVPTKLANFTARIVAQITRDDGVESTKSLEIEARVGSHVRRFTITAAQFGSMSWVIEHLGAEAVVSPSMGLRDHLRAAIQTMSTEIASYTVHTHSGWRQIDGRWVYLHAGGAIGAVGPVDCIQVALESELSLLRLPPPPEGQARIDAIRSSLSLLGLCGDDAAGDRVVVPILGLTYRAPLGPCDVSLHLFGETGAHKSELIARAQQHYGAGFVRTSLLSWTSTANHTEVMAFIAKDAILTIDDYVPQGSAQDRARLDQQADRIFRGAGNRSGRGRLRSDGTPRPTRFPRGIVFSTGEEVPGGRSRQARIVLIEVPAQPKNHTPVPGAVRLDVLTRCQRLGEDGVLAQAMAAYIRWIAGRHDATMAQVKVRFVEIRDQARDLGTHTRDPEKAAHIAVGWEFFLAFAVEAEALTLQQAEAIKSRVWTALDAMAAAQAVHQVASDPVLRFLSLVTAAVSSGAAHVAGRDGSAPSGDELRCGWARRVMGAGGSDRADWLPRGIRIGWQRDDDLYLDADAALKAAHSMSGYEILASADALSRGLRNKKLLRSIDANRNRIKIRVSVEGRRADVWHCAAESILPSGDRPNRPDRPTHAQNPSRDAEITHSEWDGAVPGDGPPSQPPAQLKGQAGLDPAGESTSGDGRDGWDGDPRRGEAPSNNSPPQPPTNGRVARRAVREAGFKDAKRRGLRESDLRVHRNLLRAEDLTEFAVAELEQRLEREVADEQRRIGAGS